MTVPTVEGLLTAPYVSVPEFRASPTWIDSDDLIPGGIQSQQDDELYNVLLRASAWADSHVNQRLGAHTAFEQTRARIDRWGRLMLHPSNVPVRQVVGLAYGADFQNMTQLTDLTQIWVEDARGIVVALTPMQGTWSGYLQFGPPVATGCEVYVEYQYVAGYACTTLAATATQGTSSITVADATGFQPSATTLWGGTVPGSTARIWDVGKEEAIVVGTNYTAGQTTIPLASPLASTHTPSAGPGGQIAVSELPAEVRMAIISYTVALLMKQDASEDEPFAGSSFGPSVRRSRSRGAAGGLVEDAYEWLEKYRRVR